MEIIDSHCHVYPKISYLLKENATKIPAIAYPLIKQIEILEEKLAPGSEQVYEKIIPLLTKMHKVMGTFNNQSESLISLKDKLYTLGSIGTLFCHSSDDLEKQMSKFGITKSLIISHPPFISNDFILELAKKNPNLIPIINIPEPVDHLEHLIKCYLKRGAKGLKIHAAASGLSPNHVHHKEMIKLAHKYDLPTIIHTGSLEIYPLYKKPEYGHAEEFSALVELTDSPIILAHMNIHFPETAIEMCKIYPHVYTDTSWQNEENILRAINKCGADKVMFGTDWPIVGNNIDVSLNRLLQLKENKKISEAELEQVLSKSAKSVFKL